MMADALAFANVVLAFVTAIIQARRAIVADRAHRLWPALISAVLFYWGLVYAYILFDRPGMITFCAGYGWDCSSDNWFGAAFIRPALTFTFALWLALSLRRRKADRL